MRFGGLAIRLFHNDVKYEYENSRKLTSSLIQLNKDQDQIYSVKGTEQKLIKTNVKIKKNDKATLTKLRTHLNENRKCLNNITQGKKVSNYLTAYPISDQGYDFNKQQYDTAFVHIMPED